MTTPPRMEQLQIKVGLQLIANSLWRHRNVLHHLASTHLGTTNSLHNPRLPTAASPDPTVGPDKECDLQSLDLSHGIFSHLNLIQLLDESLTSQVETDHLPHQRLLLVLVSPKMTATQTPCLHKERVSSRPEQQLCFQKAKQLKALPCRFLIISQFSTLMPSLHPYAKPLELTIGPPNLLLGTLSMYQARPRPQ